MNVSKPKPIPINKICQHCKQSKLLSEFKFDMSLKTKNRRAVTCNNCMKQFEVDEQEDIGHTEDCIENKFLLAVALSQNWMLIPDDILGLIEQDEKNTKDQED